MKLPFAVSTLYIPTLNTNTNLTYRIQISNEIQAIAANESTMINVGYGIDLFPIVNATEL